VLVSRKSIQEILEFPEMILETCSGISSVSGSGKYAGNSGIFSHVMGFLDAFKSGNSRISSTQTSNHGTKCAQEIPEFLPKAVTSAESFQSQKFQNFFANRAVSSGEQQTQA
jgi:hypothetical protein